MEQVDNRDYAQDAYLDRELTRLQDENERLKQINAELIAVLEREAEVHRERHHWLSADRVVRAIRKAREDQ